MRDIATLKERVEVAERHLKTTEAARNRESEALMETWRKVRERFNHQEGEIARYRAEVEQLAEDNQTLSRMVDELIAIIDGNIERGRDETVPKIATMAEELLASEPTPHDLASFAGDSPVAPAADDAMPAIDPDADGIEVDPLDWDDDVVSAADDDEADEDFDLEVERESLSPGIQALIRRVEGSVQDRNGFERAADSGDVDPAGEADDDLARELEEIEMLRNELSGLRDRIAAGDA